MPRGRWETTLEEAARLRLTALMPPLVARSWPRLRQVVLACFCGLAGLFDPCCGQPFRRFMGFTHCYLTPVLTDSFNLEILGFTFGFVGMVTVVGRMGGTGLVNIMSRFAKSPRSAQLVTASMEPQLFDDYATTVVVGTTARA